MMKKMVLIITIMSVSVLLNGMKKTKEQKSKQPLQELTSSTEETGTLSKNSSKMSVSSTNSGKLPIKNLNDLKDMRRAQSEFRDKTLSSKSEHSSDKK